MFAFACLLFAEDPKIQAWLPTQRVQARLLYWYLDIEVFLESQSN